MSDLKIYMDKDIDTDLIKSKKIAIIGFGSQGYGQGLNLVDSGCDVVFGLREGGGSYIKAKDYGLKVMSIPDAVKYADIVQILIPDDFRAFRGECAVLSGAYHSLCIPIQSAIVLRRRLRPQGTCTFSSPEALHTHINIYRTRGAWALSVSAMHAVIASGEAEFSMLLQAVRINKANLLTAEGSECGRMKGNL